MSPHFPKPFWSNRVRSSLEFPADGVLGTTDWVSQRLRGADLTDSIEPSENDTCAAVASLPYVSVPENYEANYAYPLIVWLTDPQHDERQLLDLMPLLSEQNYLGMSLPACGPAGRLLARPEATVDSAVEDVALRLHERVCQVRRLWHVHSERIYAAGCDAAAGLALELLLRHPEWLAGSLVFGHVHFPMGGLLTHYHELHGKRVFVGTDLRQPRESLSAFVRTTRLLHTAGLSVSARLYEAEEPVTAEMLAEANHWLMEGVCESHAV